MPFKCWKTFIMFQLLLSDKENYDYQKKNTIELWLSSRIFQPLRQFQCTVKIQIWCNGIDKPCSCVTIDKNMLHLRKMSEKILPISTMAILGKS